MKTNKEYPATHSMSTTWYAADEDGNVAIIDFDDNGPVPIGIPTEGCFENVVFDQMIINSKSFLQESNYTEEQALDFINDAKSVDKKTDNMIFDSCIVQIDIKKEDTFLKILSNRKRKHFDDITSMTISKKHGIYYLSLYGEDKLISRLFEEHVITKYKDFYFDIDEEFRDGKWQYIFDRKEIPFYVYKQPYRPTQLIERISIPKHPLKIDQIPNDAPRIIRLPFKFYETKLFQIAEFCKSNSPNGYVTIDGIENYIPMQLTNGECVFFHDAGDKTEYFRIDDAFDNHHVEIDYAVEYSINGKRGYFLENEDKNYYRIGSQCPTKITANDIVEIFNDPIKKI